MPSDDFISIEAAPRLEINPTLNILNSMIMTTLDEMACESPGIPLQGETPSDEAYLIMNGFYHGIIPQRTFSGFPQYLEYMSQCDPLEIRNNILNAYKVKHDLKTGSLKDLAIDRLCEIILKSPEDYLHFLSEAFDPSNYSEEIERKAYDLLTKPQEMQSRIYNFLSDLWETSYKDRWTEQLEDLKEFVKKTDLSYLRGLDRAEAINQITGMNIEEKKLKFLLDVTNQLVFIPSYDLKNGFSKMPSGRTLYILFDVEAFEKRRLNAQLSDIDELARKLGAIADVNRLKVLKYIVKKGEACSQDILKDLGFSQSAVSRHLQQLSTTGILTERRQISAKFYRVNGEYLRNVLDSVTSFLGV